MSFNPTHAAVTADGRRAPARRMIEHVMIEHARSSADIAELREMYRQTDQIRAAILDRVNELAAEAEADVRLATPGELIARLLACRPDPEALMTFQPSALQALQGMTGGAADPVTVAGVLSVDTVSGAREMWRDFKAAGAHPVMLDLIAAKGRALKGDA